LKHTYDTITSTFGDIDNGSFGLPRYENDSYRRVSEVAPPNWWFITSLWIAQYKIEVDELAAAQEIIAWVEQHASTTSIMSERINPLDETRVSVEPLTWSHAEYLSTLLDTIADTEQ